MAVGYSSFEELAVWKRACRVAVEVFALMKDSKYYSLKDQMTRSAISIASNIAEGAERGSAADFSRFLQFSKGSAAELRTQTYIAVEIGAIPFETQGKNLISELKELSSMLNGLIRSLK